jgi:hypothetical protein
MVAKTHTHLLATQDKTDARACPLDYDAPGVSEVGEPARLFDGIKDCRTSGDLHGAWVMDFAVHNHRYNAVRIECTAASDMTIVSTLIVAGHLHILGWKPATRAQ